eukprot:576786_1
MTKLMDASSLLQHVMIALHVAKAFSVDCLFKLDFNLWRNFVIFSMKKKIQKATIVWNISFDSSRFNQGACATQQQSNDFCCRVVSICMMSVFAYFSFAFGHFIC